MKVKFIYESQLCWRTERVVDVQDNVSHSDIQKMFPRVLDVKYDNETCSYNVIGDGHIYTDSEMLAYTE